MALFIVSAMVVSQASAQGSSGATLQACKTLEICKNADGTWKYHGEVSVWNVGLNDAEGLNIHDCLQYKTATQKKEPQDWLCQDVDLKGITTIPGLTEETEAYRFTYDFTGAPLDVSGTIRNSAQVTITNHSGKQVNGPNPKFTWTGGEPPDCEQTPCGCTYGQGYWGSKPGVVWPENGPQKTDVFFNSGLTYQEIMDESDAGGNAYINLAHQYIAAVLNVANGACEPESVATYIALAAGYFSSWASGSYFCATGGPPGTVTCGLQVTWAGVLEDYNEGTGDYVDNPGHCIEES
jgi:hypothetical protein